jgi:phosphatidylglycerol:prolipoprotein diacylglycerol transferase
MHPILFQYGSFVIHSYGVLVLSGFLIALWYAMHRARTLIPRTPQGENPITADHVFDVSLYALFLSVIGARLLFVLLDLNEFRSNPWDVFKIWTGGLSIHGAIVVGILWVAWYCHKHRLSFLAFGDLLAPAFALGYAIGRIGCFLNGCCYGGQCSEPWGVVFPDAGPMHRHPTQIYATIMNLAFFFTLDMFLKKPHKRGAIFLSYLALYCIYRFIDEHFRAGATADIFILGLTDAQVFSLLCLPVIFYFLWKIHHKESH